MLGLVLVGLISGLGSVVDGFHFELKRVEKRCFYKEAQDEIVTLRYEVYNKYRLEFIEVEVNLFFCIGLISS